MSRNALAMRFDLPESMDTVPEFLGTDQTAALYSEKLENATDQDLASASEHSDVALVDRIRVMADALMAENDGLRADPSPVAQTVLRLNREILRGLSGIEGAARIKEALVLADRPAPAGAGRVGLSLVPTSEAAAPQLVRAQPGYPDLGGKRRHP